MKKREYPAVAKAVTDMVARAGEFFEELVERGRLKSGGSNGRSAENTSAVVEAFRTLRLSVLQARGGP